MKIVILAGGSGTRLWPMSRNNKPKQFYNILSNEPLLKQTYNRFINEFDTSDIFIATNKKYVDNIKEIFPAITKHQLIIEPCKRDTGPAMGNVSAYMSIFYPNEVMAFICSDHYIENIDKFIKTLKIAEKLILNTGKMVDIGIKPRFATSVLGYTHIGSRIDRIDDVEIFEFLGHKEKPEYEKAKQFIESGQYLWHANFYIWTPNNFLQAFREYAPSQYFILMKIKENIVKKDFKSFEQNYRKLNKISIDYAITEKMAPNDILIIKGDFGWSDIGAWDVLYDIQRKKFDKNGNLINGLCIKKDTSNTLVYGNNKKIIALFGLDDMIVIDTSDALLICPKGKAQQLKQLLNEINEQGLEDFL